MFKVTVLRRDASASVVEYPVVKHVVWKANGNILAIYMGEHGKSRVVVEWPKEVIDHVRTEELSY